MLVSQFPPQNMTTIIDALNWRYATKKFDPTKKVSDSDMEEILEAGRLAPSSYGLQPWTFVVVTDPAVRAELRKEAWDQTQITDASALIVLCAKTSLSTEYVGEFIHQIATARGQEVAELNGYKDMVSASIDRQNPQELISWNQKQTYIALGFLIETASLKQIDTCPMEGFSAEGFDRVLGLKEKGLTATVLCAVGYRAADDPYAKNAKARFSKERVVMRV